MLFLTIQVCEKYLLLLQVQPCLNTTGVLVHDCTARDQLLFPGDSIKESNSSINRDVLVHYYDSKSTLGFGHFAPKQSTIVDYFLFYYFIVYNSKGFVKTTSKRQGFCTKNLENFQFIYAVTFYLNLRVFSSFHLHI